MSCETVASRLAQALLPPASLSLSSRSSNNAAFSTAYGMGWDVAAVSPPFPWIFKIDCIRFCAPSPHSIIVAERLVHESTFAHNAMNGRAFIPMNIGNLFMIIRHFESFAKTSAGCRANTLLGTHLVKPKDIFAAVIANVTELLPYLEDGCKYTTEMLCGPDTWAAWTAGEHRVAGMCLAYLVRHRVVALVRHKTRSGRGSARYIKGSPPVAVAPKITRLRYMGDVPQLTCLQGA